MYDPDGLEVGNMRMRALGVGLLVALALSAPAFAVVCVRTDGSDGQSGDSWYTAKATVQAGINAAAANGGDDVWIAAGTYRGGFTVKDGVNLYGGFLGYYDERDIASYPTVIYGGQSSSAIKVATGAEVAISGLEIRSGSASYGGGIYAKGANVTVQDCYLGGNRASQSGGAIYVSGGSLFVGSSTLESNNASVHGGCIYGSNASVRVTYCTMRSNYARQNGGAVYTAGGSLIMEISTVVLNKAGGNGGGFCASRSEVLSLGSLYESNTAYSGGAIECDYAPQSLIQDNDFFSNTATYGGGVSCLSGSKITLLRGWFIGNQAKYGGGMYISNSPVLVGNVLFDSNKATTYGGGVYVRSQSAVKLINATVVRNTSHQGGGICTLYSTASTVANTILANNTAEQGGGIYKDSRTTVSVYRLLTYANGPSNLVGAIDMTEGNGVIEADPLFVDPANGDFHLWWYSPAVNAGDDRFVDPSWTELDNNPRQVGPAVDMGAYEAQ